ncbi:wd repeat protein [Moniliophthora roreri MCA 2997]|uniref:Wd repeat protein n=1 Tax=Moniliophthora roreri (strain MCA 2997) TaxID=1381753 RepID=V2XVG2_MONRO|nr:wd repeat protein [Moniliophthora roreri MCA 2997]
MVPQPPNTTEKRLVWHPRHLNRFIVGGGSQITLYECTTSQPEIRHVTSQNDLQFMKCFAWSPDPLFDDMLAIGHNTGRVDLIRLEASRYTGADNVLSTGPVVALPVKNHRSCNTLAFCGKDPNYLAVGLDKVRGDASLVIWDVSSAMPLLSFGGANSSLTHSTATSNAMNFLNQQQMRSRPTPHIPRADQLLGPRADSRMLQVHATTEHVSSLAFLPDSTHLLLAGISNRWLRLFDLRTPMQPPNTPGAGSNVASKVHGVATDPFDQHRIASWGEGVVSVWDTRKFTVPLLTFTERDGAADGGFFVPSLLSTSASTSSLSGLPSRKGSGLISVSTPERATPNYTAVEFSANRRGQLATLAKDASFVRIWDILEAAMPSALASFSHSEPHSVGEPASDKNGVRGRLVREREKSIGRDASISSISGGRKQTHSLSKRSWPNFPSWGATGRVPSLDGDQAPAMTSLVLCDTRKTHPLIPLSASQHPPTSPRSLTSFALVPSISLYDRQQSTTFTKIVIITSTGELALQTLHDSPNAESVWSAKGHIGGIGYPFRGGNTNESVSDTRSAILTDTWVSLSKSKSKSKSKSQAEVEEDERIIRGRPLGTAVQHRFNDHEVSNQPPFQNRSLHAKVDHFNEASDTQRPSVVERGRRQVKNVRTRSNIAIASVSRDPIHLDDDICTIMKRRAERGYGFENVLHNAALVREFSCSSSFSESKSLKNLWKWLYHVQSHLNSPTGHIQGYDFTYLGVWAIWNGSGQDGHISYDSLLHTDTRPEVNKEAASADATPVHRNNTELPLLLDGSILGEPLGKKSGKHSKSKKRHQSQPRTTSSSGREKERGSSPANGVDEVWQEVLKELVARFSLVDIEGAMASVRVSTSKTLQRQACLGLLGWGSEALVGFDPQSVRRVGAGEAAKGELSRVACWLVFLGKWERAVDVLLSSSDEIHHMMSATITVLAPLMLTTDSGLSNDANALPSHLRTHYTRLSSRLQDPYLWALLSYLTTGDVRAILDIKSDGGTKKTITVDDCKTNIAFRERLTLAFVFLDDKSLTIYLRSCVEKALRDEGDDTSNSLDVLAVTGLATQEGRELLSRWTDQTADVQSAAILGWMGLARSLDTNSGNRTTLKGKPARAQREDKRRVERWVETYRDLLDSWQMFRERVEFDIERGAIGQGAMSGDNKLGGKTGWPAMPKQIIIRCNYCNKPITPLPQARSDTASIISHKIGKPTVCPHCSRALPRCSVCLMTLSIIQDSARDAELMRRTQQRDTIDEAIVICQTCRHGGHASHIIGWFFGESAEDGDGGHDVCPVADCDCRCANQF